MKTSFLPIAVGEVLRPFEVFAAQRANVEATELFDTVELSVAVRAGAKQSLILLIFCMSQA